MMRASLSSLILALVISLPLMGGAHPVFSRYPQVMGEAVEAISALPEAQRLLEEVYREGRVELISENLYGGQFAAFWVGGRRVICVPEAHRKGKGVLIQSILFELHNARANRKIGELDRLAYQRKIARAPFVEATERLEHQNALEACALLEKGIERGLFPRSSRWWMPPHFDDYFRIQKRAGHSGWIGRKYDRMRT